MKRIKPTGIYGYLGRHLLRMASKSGTYIYYTENKDLIEEYKFKAIREPFLKGDYIRHYPISCNHVHFLSYILLISISLLF